MFVKQPTFGDGRLTLRDVLELAWPLQAVFSGGPVIQHSILSDGWPAVAVQADSSCMACLLVRV